jgi:hypothetical protein
MSVKLDMRIAPLVSLALCFLLPSAARAGPGYKILHNFGYGGDGSALGGSLLHANEPRTREVRVAWLVKKCLEFSIYRYTEVHLIILLTA